MYTNGLACLPLMYGGKEELLAEIDWTPKATAAFCFSCALGIAMSYFSFLCRKAVSAASFTVRGRDQRYQQPSSIFKAEHIYISPQKSVSAMHFGFQKVLSEAIENFSVKTHTRTHVRAHTQLVQNSTPRSSVTAAKSRR